MSIASKITEAANRSDLKAMNTFDAKGRQGPKKWSKVARIQIIFWDGTDITITRTDFDLYCRDITFNLGRIDSPEARRRDA